MAITADLRKNYRTNYLTNNGYQLVVPKFRDMDFYATSFVFPSMSLPAVNINTPFARLPTAGDQMEYAPISFTFMVDEYLENYVALTDWIKSISYSTAFTDFSSYEKKDQYQTLGEQDIAIIILDSKNQPSRTFRFVNAIPVSLGGFEMTAQSNDVDHVYSTVTFEYDYFDVIPNES